MRLALAPYRLYFKHPFGTAHGLRDGTDSVFVRIEHNGFVGYGEATLPPYLDETQQSVLEELRTMGLDEQLRLLEGGAVDVLNSLSQPARAALTTAYYDLMSRQRTTSVSMLLTGHVKQQRPDRALTMMTLGHSALKDIPTKLKELPASDILKVKLGSDHDIATLRAVLCADQRPLFLDANQGWTTIAEAMTALEVVGQTRLVGLEQPFAKERLDLHRELRQQGVDRLYGDESVQNATDLERAADAFTGINVKLMKCGGLDRALELIGRARELGMSVMLGSMSESSLGCAAMAQLAATADLLDLDGPWLIANDPFTGLAMVAGELAFEHPLGIGVRPVEAVLQWSILGA